MVTTTNLETPDQADVLLVTVTKVETQAVLASFRKELQQPHVRRFDGENTYLYLGDVRNARVFLVQSEMGSGGSSGSAATISDGIQTLKPKAVIMVGIAFGIDSTKQPIGTILVAKQLLDYELQRIGSGPNGDAVIRPRGDRPSCSDGLLSRFRSAEFDWKGAKVRFGLILSGDKLVDQQDFRDQLLQLEPEAIGGEMEGAGLYAVAKRQKVDWILVKAICDYADGNKAQDKDKRQQTAARNAARFVFHVLQLGGFARTTAPSLPTSQTSMPKGMPIQGGTGTNRETNTQGSPVGTGIENGQNDLPPSAPDDIKHQRRLLEIHRRTLANYLKRLAIFGQAFAPPEVDFGIREAREGIERTKSALRTLGAPVEDHPDDAPEPIDLDF